VIFFPVFVASLPTSFDKIFFSVNELLSLLKNDILKLLNARQLVVERIAFSTGICQVSTTLILHLVFHLAYLVYQLSLAHFHLFKLSIEKIGRVDAV